MSDMDLAGSIVGSSPEIKHVERLANHVDQLLTPDDHVIFLCMSCETYLLPREIHTLVRQHRDKYGRGISEIVVQCPVCHPFPDRNDNNPPASNFHILTREQYEYKRAFDRAGLEMPDNVKLIH